MIFSDVIDGEYKLVENKESISTKFTEKLRKYNLHNGTNEKLIMFDYAVSHLARIKRVLKMVRGNMVLVGLGGSGK